MSNSKNHSVAILGSGESGMGAALLAKSKGIDVFLSDSGAIPEAKKTKLTKNRIPFEENGHSINALLKYEEVIKSPGIPDKAEVVQKLELLGNRLFQRLSLLQDIQMPN